MRAAYVERLGPPDEIVVGELSVPASGPTDVLVAVELVAANPVDTFVRSERYATPVPLPFVVGRDLVGTVADAGPGALFGVGERVWANSLGHDGRQGSFSEYAVIPAERCYCLPEGATPSWLSLSRTRRQPPTLPGSSTAPCDPVRSPMSAAGPATSARP